MGTSDGVRVLVSRPSSRIFSSPHFVQSLFAKSYKRNRVILRRQCDIADFNGPLNLVDFASAFPENALEAPAQALQLVPVGRQASVRLLLSEPQDVEGFLFGEPPQFWISRHELSALIPCGFRGKGIRVGYRVAAFQAGSGQDEFSIGQESLNYHHGEVGKEALGGRGSVALRDQVEHFADVDQ